MLPGIIVFGPFVCGLIAWGIGRKREGVRDVLVVLMTAAELVLTLCLFASRPALTLDPAFAGGLHFTADGFRSVYAVITALMWTLTSLFAGEYFRHEREGLNRYWFFMIITLGAVEGVMLSADLMTAFVFFEILSMTSFTWVIHEETKEAVRAGYTYLFIAVIGGLVLFMGLLMLQHSAGTLSFAELKEACASSPAGGMILAAAICILVGFGAKAGMFPVHVWLPKAHPVAPSPASALLSGVLTKVGIYGILMTAVYVMAGNSTFGVLVLLLGVITMALGAVLALFSVNLKRTLACSSMSQIGFILTGVGMLVLLTAEGSEEGMGIALCGLTLHMVNHSLIKLTLFMAAGAVVMNLHTLRLDDIRGWGRNKPWLKAAFAFGALGISGVPFFNGYLSKTLLHEGIVEGIHELHALSGMLSVIEWVFLVSGGITFAYMLKLFICIFVEKNADAARQQAYDRERRCMGAAATAAVFGSSILMPILGQPAVTTRLACLMTGFEEILHFRAFSWTNLKGGLISLGIGGALYLLVVRHVLYRRGSYADLWPKKLDLEDLVYRPLLTRALPFIFGNIASVFGENRILAPLSKAVLTVSGALASVFGDNRILAPLSRAALTAGTFIGRALETGTDGLIVLMRRTALREKKVRGSEPGKPGFWRVARIETEEAMKPMVSNFTFAMMMTCIGILVVLCVIIFSL